MAKRINIAVITGTRAEFGIWRPVLRELQSELKFRLQLVVTGMHLLRQFGRTINDIAACGFRPAAAVKMYREEDDDWVAALGRGTIGMGKAFAKLRPHMVLVLGDRLEMLAAAQAAMCRQLWIGHVHGGETAPGQFDEQIRHAITKLSHVHFAATPVAAGRIKQMGENPQMVHVTGAPALDELGQFAGQLNVRNNFGDRRAVLLLHPAGPDAKIERQRAALVLRAARAAMGQQLLVIGPNNDPGHAGILEAYRAAGIGVAMSLSQDEFWRLLAESSCLIGNSSCGIIEAASLGIPVINVGNRQKGRQRNANVWDVPYQLHAIAQAIEKSLHNRHYQAVVARRKNLYGDGHAARRLAAILRGLPLLETPPTKQFYNSK